MKSTFGGILMMADIVKFSGCFSKHAEHNGLAFVVDSLCVQVQEIHDAALLNGVGGPSPNCAILHAGHLR